MKEEEINLFGAEEGGAQESVVSGSISIDGPLNFKQDKFNFDYYCALTAMKIMSSVDIDRFKNVDEITRNVIYRTKIFADKVKGEFPDAFE